MSERPIYLGHAPHVHMHEQLVNSSPASESRRGGTSNVENPGEISSLERQCRLLDHHFDLLLSRPSDLDIAQCGSGLEGSCS